MFDQSNQYNDDQPKSAHYYFIKSLAKPLFATIKVPPKNDSKTYANLPGSNPQDIAKIIELFTTMGNHGKIDLLMNYKSHLEQLGKEIEHVHPLKLLGIIFSTPNMKTYMDNVYNDYFKCKYFIDGLGSSMNHEITKNNLFQYVNDFALDVKADPNLVNSFLKKKDWKGLVNYLIHIP